jgi:hypothetical protein
MPSSHRDTAAGRATRRQPCRAKNCLPFPPTEPPARITPAGLHVVRLIGASQPVILRPEDYEAWVFGEPEAALKLAGPYPAQMMKALQLGQAINSSRNDYPELLAGCA